MSTFHKYQFVLVPCHWVWNSRIFKCQFYNMKRISITFVLQWRKVTPYIIMPILFLILHLTNIQMLSKNKNFIL